MIVVQCAVLSERGGGLPSAIIPVAARLAEQTNILLVSREGGEKKGLAVVHPRKSDCLPFLRLPPYLGGASLVHTHGLWTKFSFDALLWHRRTGRPTIISPHGMLDPWALSISVRRKKLALALYENYHLQSSAVVHALNEAEAQSIRALGVTTPIAIIPNGCDHQNADILPPAEFMTDKTLLFLGRLHPKKGVSELIQGFALAAPRLPGWRLAIVGWDDGSNSYRSEAAATGADIVFPGALYGPAKEAAYAHASAFILPSHSEGLPITVLEAWSAGCPVFMTEHCNLPEGFKAGAAWRIAPNPDDIAAALVRLLPDTQWQSQAQKAGRELVHQNFGWNEIAGKFQALYSWVMNQDVRPAFVHG